MLKLELSIKIILLMIFCIWTFTSHEYINRNILKKYGEMYQNIDYSTSDIIIMGGSNSRMGLRAEKIQHFTKNISISGEMGNFHNYLSFVRNKVSNPKIIIISSLKFWSFIDDSTLPSQPLINLIYSLLKKDNFAELNNYGDQKIKSDDYECSKLINKTINLSKNNNSFIKRIKNIKSFYKNTRIIVRIPPLYVDNEREKEKLLNYMLFSIKQMKHENIEVFVHSNTLYNNINLACSDNYHPNYAHSLILSEELNKYLQQ